MTLKKGCCFTFYISLFHGDPYVCQTSLSAIKLTISCWVWWSNKCTAELKMVNVNSTVEWINGTMSLDLLQWVGNSDSGLAAWLAHTYSCTTTFVCPSNKPKTLLPQNITHAWQTHWTKLRQTEVCMVTCLDFICLLMLLLLDFVFLCFLLLFWQRLQCPCSKLTQLLCTWSSAVCCMLPVSVRSCQISLCVEF